MSAFVVNDSVVNNIVTFVYKNNRKYDDKYYYCLFELRDAGYLSKDPGQDAQYAPKRLAEDMFTLNCDAVEQRYGEGEAKEFRPLDFKYMTTGLERQNVYQVLMDISCWLYQCSEGNAPENNLYKAISALRGNIAWHLISRSKAYEAAQWDKV